MPIIPLYFANGKGERYRSIGCYPCTFPVKSNAKTVREIIEDSVRTGTSAMTAGMEGSSGKLSRDIPAMRVFDRPEVMFAQ